MGDEKALGRSIDLGDARRSPEVNEEARRAESMSTTGDVRVGGKRTRQHSPQTLNDETQRFF